MTLNTFIIVFAGLLPPFGHTKAVNVIVDVSLAPNSSEDGSSKLFCGSGTHNAFLELSFGQLLKLTGGKVADITNWAEVQCPISVSRAPQAAHCIAEKVSSGVAAVEDGKLEQNTCAPRTSPNEGVRCRWGAFYHCLFRFIVIATIIGTMQVDWLQVHAFQFTALASFGLRFDLF